MDPVAKHKECWTLWLVVCHRYGSNAWRRLPVPGLNGSGRTAVRSLWADLCQWEFFTEMECS